MQTIVDTSKQKIVGAAICTIHRSSTDHCDLEPFFGAVDVKVHYCREFKRSWTWHGIRRGGVDQMDVFAFK